MGVAKDNNNVNKPPPGMPAVGEKIDAGESLGPVGNTGHVIPPPTDEKPYLGTHLHIATVEADATRAIEAQGKAIGTGGSGSLGVRLDGSTTLSPDEYLQKNADLFNPAPVTLPSTPDSSSSSSHSGNTSQTDPMGSDDGKSIMDVASAGTKPRADENYSHEGRNNPPSTFFDAKSPTSASPKPSTGPVGDAIDADLPDGTRVVSTSTTVTAELLDKDGHVLLSAGAGQTMERDPDTGIVRVRTEGSEQVQQYDPATGEISSGVVSGSNAAAAYEALLDEFNNPKLPTFGPGTVYADAGGGGLPEDFGHHAIAVTAANSNTFTNFLDAQGSTLSTAQQAALATQIDKLNLGGDKELSFYALPNGGALIANADGDIVGEINRNSATGDLNLKATAIAVDGSVVEVNNHISEQGQVVSDAAMVQGQATAMFNSLMAAGHWDDLSDLGKLSALVNLYNATDKLGEAFGATGNNLPGDLSAAAGYLQLAQGLQSGDSLVIANGINVVSDHALDNAMNNALGSTAEGEAVPYLSYALAVRNFEENPEVAIGTMAGTYIGEGLGAAFGGSIGAAIGGAGGGMIGGMVGGLFGGDDDIPMREGLAHAQWDESGQIQIITDQNAEGGGATANSWMSSLVGGLQAKLDQTVDTNGHAQYGLVPNLLPSVGFKYDPDGYSLANGAQGFMYLEWTDEAGQPQTRYYDGSGNRGDGSGETLSGDFVQHAQGAIAPAWQVQTTLAHYQQSGEIDLPAQKNSLPVELTDGLHQTLQVVSLALGNALPTEGAPSTAASNIASTRVVFVSTGQTSAQKEIQLVTDNMIESSQSLLFGGGSASLGVLAAVGVGATTSAANAAEIAQRPVVVSQAHSNDANSVSPAVMNAISSNNTFSTTPNSSSASTSSDTFKQVDLGVFNVSQVVQTTSIDTSSTVPTANLTHTETSNTTFVQATVVVSPPVSVALSKASVASVSNAVAPIITLQAPASNAQAPSLGYPVVQAETLPGTEDVVLRLTQSVLLANDSTPNASADPTLPALTITSVSAPVHGQVSLVNGEVLFAPDVDFHGTASFVYTVTDQYGLSSTTTATLQIAAVNDAPVTQGETFSGNEDIELVFTQEQLLSNDKDVDTITDGQVLVVNPAGRRYKRHG